MGIKTIREMLSFNHATAFEDEVADRKELIAKAFYTGIPVMDELFDSILPNDLILLGARSGSGKTELLTQIGQNVTKQGRYVDFFALEASKFEIHRRIKYRIAAEFLMAAKPGRRLSYMKWTRGGYDEELEQTKELQLAALEKITKYLRIHYRPGSFEMSDFVKLYHYLSKDSSLVMCDHAQFFDFDSKTNESSHVKDLSLKMYDLVNNVRVPIIIVSHLRKGESGKRVPDMDDFHGSSELYKKSTKALIICRYSYLEKLNSYETLFQMVKNREMSPATIKTVFSMDLKQYSPNFTAGEVYRDRFYTHEEMNEVDRA